MPHLSYILRARRRREAAARRRWSTRLRPWGLAILMALGLVVAGASAAAAGGYVYLTADLPSPAVLPAWLDAPHGLLLTPSRYLAAQGEPLAAVAPAPQPVTLNDLPAYAPQAILAAVDPDFYAHPGYAGHFWQTDLPPTVAERLATRFLLFAEPASTRRRLRARILAAQMVSQYGHDKVLTWYLNIADFGHGFYGLEAASQGYLGKSAADLSLSEAALLAAILPDPALNPWDAPEIAEQRRQQLIMTMLSQARITAPQSQDALPDTPHVLPPPQQASPSPLLVLAKQQVAADWPLPERGLTVFTSVDASLQAQADCLREAVLQASPNAENQCSAARFLPPLLLEHPLPPDADLEAVVLDATNGSILALSLPQPEPASHPPGSVLAPWVYAVAFSRGFAPATLTWDVPASLPSGVEAANADGEFHGPMRLRVALANDYLVPTLHLLDQLGPQTVWATAARIGLPALQGQAALGYGLLLDQGHLNLVELAHGYEAFATLGRWRGLPHDEVLTADVLAQVVDADGNLRFDYRPAQQGVLSPGLAYLVTDVLADQAAKWPSLGHPNPLEIGRPLAAHVGQNSEGGVWVVGYTPRRVIAVYAQGRTAAQSQDAALAYWHALAREALASQPVESWPRPPDITEVTVCDPSGMLPTADCPNLVDEVFLQGTEPTTADTLYRRVAVDRETGLRATVFTPPQLVEEQVFMMVPPEARAWAQQAGLPLPPEGYDLVTLPQPSPNAVLVSPRPFAYVEGEVPLRGTAAGEGFASYRVQVGQGLNPQAWVVVAEGKQPVKDGLLGQWQTKGLSGLYAVQLLVTDQQGKVTTFTTQVTVDDRPPRVAFARPREADVKAAAQQGRLIVQAEAEDDLRLAWVRLEVDGREIATLQAPPYLFAVPLQPGVHRLRLVAADAAGNESQAVQKIVLP